MKWRQEREKREGQWRSAPDGDQTKNGKGQQHVISSCISVPTSSCCFFLHKTRRQWGGGGGGGGRSGHFVKHSAHQKPLEFSYWCCGTHSITTTTTTWCNEKKKSKRRRSWEAESSRHAVAAAAVAAWRVKRRVGILPGDAPGRPFFFLVCWFSSSSFSVRYSRARIILQQTDPGGGRMKVAERSRNVTTGGRMYI